MKQYVKRAKQQAIKDNAKHFMRKVGFKFFEVMNTIKLGGTKLDTIFCQSWAKMEAPIKPELNYALASQGKYCPKENGCAYNWFPKKKKQQA